MTVKNTKSTSAPLADSPKSLMSLAAGIRFMTGYADIISTGIYNALYENYKRLFKANGMDITRIPKKLVKGMISQVSDLITNTPFQDTTQMYNEYVKCAGGTLSPQQKKDLMILLTRRRLLPSFNAVVNSPSFPNFLNMIRQEYFAC